MEFHELEGIPNIVRWTEDSPRCSLGYVAVSKGQAVAVVTSYPHESARLLGGWIVPYVAARDLFLAAREIREHCVRMGWRVWEEDDALEALGRVIAEDLAKDLLDAASQ